MQAMLILVFVFMLFNLTSIWNLPTISIGGRGRDGIPSLIGLGARLFVCGLTRKAAQQGISRWRQPPMILCHATLVRSIKVACLLNQIAPPLSYMGLNLACIVQHFLHGGAILGHGAFPQWCQRVVPSPLATIEPVCPRTALWF